VPRSSVYKIKRPAALRWRAVDSEKRFEVVNDQRAE
jgi:hypothetical protein